MEAQAGAAPSWSCIDPRMSNTASPSRPLAARRGPGSEAALLLAIARTCCAPGRSTRDFMRTLGQLGRLPATGCIPDAERDLRDLHRPRSRTTTRAFTFEFAAAESAGRRREDRRARRRSSPAPARALAAHIWRSAAAGNLGGWQIARCLFFLIVLTGSVGTRGRHQPQRLEQVHRPRLRRRRRAPDDWNELLLPREYPLSLQRDVDPAAALPQGGRGKLDVYFTRVYNPLWTNPDGFTWMEALTSTSDESGCTSR